MKPLDFESSARPGAFLFRPLGMRDSVVAAMLSTIPLLWLWWTMVHGMPIDFWGLPIDSPVMSLSHAVNIDFWLNEPGRRAVTAPQWYHPGLIYQLVSFVVYRSTIPGAMPLDRFDAVILDPEPFWAVLQMVPITFTLVSVLALWLAGRLLGLLAALAAAAVFFVATPVLRFGIYDFFNESVSLFMAVAFFLSAPAAFAAQPAHRTRVVVLFGVVGGLLYLLKMNYVIWALAAVPAYAAAAWLGRITWREARLFRCFSA